MIKPALAKEPPMRIRDLQWKGMPSWPPEWGVSDEGAGEDGILKNVQIRYDQSPTCISVVVSHGGDSRNGIIVLEDSASLEILCKKLKDNIGRPISEIGDLSIDFFPGLPLKSF